MALFEYSGLNAQGKKVSGVVEATGRRAALLKLREQSIFPTVVREGSASAPRRKLELTWTRQRRVKTTDLAAMTRQLATLLGAGLPLDATLATVGGQIDQPVLTRTLGLIREEVIQGHSLHTALAMHGKLFPSLYVNMVQVGENTGTLDQVLERLADFLEEQARMRSRVQSALAYPILMAVVGVGVLAFLFAFVVPKVTRMLEDLGQALPWPTQALISLSDFLSAYWWLFALLLVAGLVAAQRYRRTEAGRLAFDRLALRLPLFGRLHLLITTARLARTLGTLLHSGVPLLKALDITRNLLTNRILRQTIEETTDAVREGESLAEPLRRSGVFPPMLSQMAAVGEKSGDLENMLFRVATAYEHQVDMTLNGLLSLLEPIMILVMGVAVGFIVLAILLPIFQASQGIG